MVCVTLNRLDFMKQTWTKVYEPVLQKYQDVELIIVDNGSTQPGKIEYLQEQLKKYPTQTTLIQFQKNKGIACALNAAIRLSRGQFIARCGDDILMPENWYEEGMKLLGLHKMIDGVVWSFQREGGVRYEPEGTIHTFIDKKGKPHAIEQPKQCCIGSNILKKEVYRKVGYLYEGYDFWSYNDLDYWNRMIENKIFLVFGPGLTIHLQDRQKEIGPALQGKRRQISREKNEALFMKRWSTETIGKRNYKFKPEGWEGL